MALFSQTVALLKAADQLARELPADAVLMLTETDLPWDQVMAELRHGKLLVASRDRTLMKKFRPVPGLIVLDVDAGPAPTRELLSMALLEAVASEHLKGGAHVVAVYNGIDVSLEDIPEQIDSLSVVHLGEHLERLTAADLRRLDTQVPLETLRAVVDLATQIGMEGREGKPVGTMFVVGDTRKVMSYSRPINYNPFRGYSRKERDIRDRRVREQIKDIAQLEGAILIRRDGIAQAACMNITVDPQEITLSKGLGTRHYAAAAISRATKAIAVAVSQSSGTVRLFQDGEVVLQIEPLARPVIWQNFKMDGDGTDKSRQAARRPPSVSE
jgi:DNA integrity scanning protein DisA with diadenylate cyclase activity